MNYWLSLLLLSCALTLAGCAFGPPAPTPTPTTPPPLATAQAVVTAAKNAEPITPTPRPMPAKHGRTREDPAPAESGLPLEEGYVVFAKIHDDDAAERVRSFNATNPPAAAGKRYISVSVIMSSGQQAGKSMTISSNQFGLICSSGARFKPLTNLGAKGLDGEMGGGRQLLGELVFEIPKEEQSHLLTFVPSGSASTEYYLSLKSGSAASSR